MKNLFIRKYLGVLFAFGIVFSLGFAAAQITGGGAQITCVRYNADGSCAQTAVSGNISVGAPRTGTVGNTGTPGINGNQPVYTGQSAYVAGQAQRGTNTADLSFIGNLLNQVGGIIRLLPPIFMGAAVVAFFWFLIRYFITQAPDEKGVALKRMGYSLAAIFVMVALWGIIAFFGDAIGINPNVQVNAPQLPR
ncbi:MAG: hypothetical protein RI945_168 [Candidatus Parcubacteria bacterium]